MCGSCRFDLLSLHIKQALKAFNITIFVIESKALHIKLNLNVVKYCQISYPDQFINQIKIIIHPLYLVQMHRKVLTARWQYETIGTNAAMSYPRDGSTIQLVHCCLGYTLR